MIISMFYYKVNALLNHVEVLQHNASIYTFLSIICNAVFFLHHKHLTC
jgi:hypothetical protein